MAFSFRYPRCRQFCLVLLCLVYLIVTTTSCEKVDKLVDGMPTPPPEIVTPSKPLVQIELKPDRDLEKEIAEIAAEAKGKVGIAAIHLETGRSASLNAHESFPMQSVYKLPIAMALMHLIDNEKIALDEMIAVGKDDFVSTRQHSPIREKNPDGVTLSVRELLRASVSESDGTASDVLLRLAGGPTSVQDYLAAIGVSNIAVANPEKEIFLDWETQFRNFATPNGAVELLRCVHEGNGVSEPNRELLLKFMTDATTGPGRLKGLLPKGTQVAHKTGTSGSRDGKTAATNDIGIITTPDGGHIVIAVFVSDSPADEKTREAVIAKVAKAVWDRSIR